MEINITGTAKEIAVLVLELQGRQGIAKVSIDGEAVARATRDILKASGWPSKILEPMRKQSTSKQSPDRMGQG